MFSWLVPQEKKFFDFLEQYADLARECSGKLMELFRDFEKRDDYYLEIKIIESKGDDLMHKIVDELNTTFITPIDREDIYELANRLDDILDFNEGVAERVMLFKLTEPTRILNELSDILYQSSKELAAAMPLMRVNKKWKDMKKHFVEINRLENAGDRLMRKALVELFETKEAVEIIKLKEIYEHIEEAIDRCEDVAEILENLGVKHS
jgi:predicted phosphate transport protein (TIGR00153 family)